MEKSAKLFTIFMAVTASIAIGIIEGSVGLGFIAGVSMFNMFVLMAITAENI